MENIQASTVNIYNYDQGNQLGEDALDFSQMSVEELIKKLAEMTDGPGGMAVETAAGSIADAAGKALVDLMIDKIESDDSIPQAKKDAMIATMEKAEQENGLDTPQEIQDMMAELKEKYKEEMQEILEEEIQATAEGTGGEAGGAEGEGGGAGGAGGGAGAAAKSGHWMVALSEMMSKFAGDHLEKMIGIQSEISILEGNAPIAPGKDASDDEIRAFGEAQAKHASQFTQLTAQAQAHTQMFKMAQEMTTTIIKSLGEALNSTVRKQ